MVKSIINSNFNEFILNYLKVIKKYNNDSIKKLN